MTYKDVRIEISPMYDEVWDKLKDIDFKSNKARLIIRELHGFTLGRDKFNTKDNVYVLFENGEIYKKHYKYNHNLSEKDNDLLAYDEILEYYKKRKTKP